MNQITIQRRTIKLPEYKNLPRKKKKAVKKKLFPRIKWREVPMWQVKANFMSQYVCGIDAYESDASKSLGITNL